MFGRRHIQFGFLLFTSSFSANVFADECLQESGEVSHILEAAEQREPLNISAVYHIGTPKASSDKVYVAYIANAHDKHPRNLEEAKWRGAYQFDSQREANAFVRRKNKEMQDSGYANGYEWRASVIKDANRGGGQPTYINAGPAQNEALQRLKNIIIEAGGEHGLSGGARRDGITSLQLTTIDVSGASKSDKEQLVPILMPSRIGHVLKLNSVIGDSNLAREIDYANRSLLTFYKETDEFNERLSKANSIPLDLEFVFSNSDRYRELDYMGAAVRALNWQLENGTAFGMSSGIKTLRVQSHSRPNKGKSTIYIEGDSLVVSVGIDSSMSTKAIAEETAKALRGSGQAPMTNLEKALR